MLTLPSSVKIYVAATPIDARKSFDGLSALVQSEFGLEPLSGHLFAFINRRGHIAQWLFWDRNGFNLMKNQPSSHYTSLRFDPSTLSFLRFSPRRPDRPMGSSGCIA